MDKAIRSAKLTAAGILDKRRAKTAVERAGGQIAPSKYLPDVPRQVHAAGGYVPQSSIAYKSLPVGQAPALTGGTSLGDVAQLASMLGGKEEAPQQAPQHSPGDGHDHSGMSDAAVQAWGKLTDAYGQPLTVVSGYRDPQQNEAAGGAKGSQHLHGNAYDVDTSNMSYEDRLALATQAYNSGFRGFGFYDNNMHFDVGDQRAWGPSYSSDSIPQWAQPFVQQYVARADGGKVEDAINALPHVGQNRNGVPPEEAVASPLPRMEYPYMSMTPARSVYADPLRMAINKAHAEAKIEDVPMDKIVTDVGAIGKSKIRNPSEGVPFVERINGVHHLRDGNHRAAAAFLRGDKSIKALVANMDEAIKRNGRSATERADGGKVENFQSWFGNSVTHTDGEPHVFYTGTSKDKDFTAFNVGRHGAWFTRDPEVASSYAEQNDSQGYKWEGGRPIKTNTASRVIPAYIKAENPYTGEYSGATTGNYKSDQSNWFDTLRAKGHDAWIPASSNGQLAVALKEPQQIKSIYNNGKFDPNQKHMNRALGGRTVNKLNMYSKAAEVARSLPQAKGSVDQMLAMLRKGGVKPAELEHAGRPAGDMIDRETLAKHFEDRLPKVRAEQYGEQPRSMTQDENQEYNHLMNRHHASQYRTGAARAEPLSSQELDRFADLRSRLSRKDPISVIETGEDEVPADTSYGDYQTPGGTDYRERLLTLPKRKGTPSWTVSGPSMLVSREHDTKEAADADAEQMNSRLSPDIHPSRRHRVFETTRKSPDNYQSGHWSNNANVLAHIRMKDMPVDGKRALHVEEIQSDWAQEGRKQGFRPTDGSSAAKDALPNAPYVKNTAHWTDLALKNVLAEAAHGRYDHVTFTGGQEQADRYGLEKSLSAIHYTPETKTLHAERIGQHRPIIQQDVAPEQVASYIGSEAASKLLDPSNAYDVGGVRRHSLVDDDLKMGGEGMKGYYDNILPKAAMKLVQQHDPSIQPSTINGNFGFTMTPKARESILQGQPAFAKGGEVDNNNQGDNQYGQNTTGNRQIGTETQGLPVAGGVRGGQGLLPAPAQASGEKDLIGLPTSVKMPKLGMTLTAGHDPRIRAVARDYAQTTGLDYNPPTVYQKVDPERAKRIAAAYEAMPHDPDHPLVKASYNALLNETLGQYQAMKRAGMKMEFYPDPSQDPYKSNPRLAVEDVRNNNHMYVYPTDAGFGSGPELTGKSENPMLGDSGEKWNGKPVMFNDLFRAVHDYFGHAKEGVGFRADGEENAWRSHAAMFSPLARIALGTETRGQNSWLNYGPHGEKNRTATTEDTVFADQKLGILPEWAHHEGAEDFIRPHERQQMQAIYRTHRRSVGGALDLTSRFTKNGAGVMMSLKSKGK